MVDNEIPRTPAPPAPWSLRRVFGRGRPTGAERPDATRAEHTLRRELEKQRASERDRMLLNLLAAGTRLL